MLKHPNGSDIDVTNSSKEIEIMLNRESSLVAEARREYWAVNLTERVKLHTLELNITSETDVYVLRVEPTEQPFDGQLQVFLSYAESPNITDDLWNRTYRMPPWYPNGESFLRVSLVQW